ARTTVSGRAWVRIALPVSIAVSWASSSEAASSASAQATSFFWRSLNGRAAHSGKAFRAAWTARSASASLPLGTLAMTTLRSIGVMTSVVSPSAASTHSPPMSIFQFLASGNSDISVLSYNDELLRPSITLGSDAQYTGSVGDRAHPICAGCTCAQGPHRGDHDRGASLHSCP